MEGLYPVKDAEGNLTGETAWETIDQPLTLQEDKTIGEINFNYDAYTQRNYTKYRLTITSPDYLNSTVLTGTDTLQ